MKVAEAIDRADALRPNRFSAQDKLRWLEGLDGVLESELLRPHGLAAPVPEADDDPALRELALGAPYADELYTAYLTMQIDRYNGETERYNQSAALFNSVLRAARNAINRETLPVGDGKFTW